VRLRGHGKARAGSRKILEVLIRIMDKLEYVEHNMYKQTTSDQTGGRLPLCTK
jgi:hypothetical protein